MELEELKAAFDSANAELKSALDAARAEVASSGTLAQSVKAALDEIQTRQREQGERLFAIEQKQVARIDGPGEVKSRSDIVTTSDDFVAFKAGRGNTSGQIIVPNFARDIVLQQDLPGTVQRDTAIRTNRNDLFVFRRLFGNGRMTTTSLEYIQEDDSEGETFDNAKIVPEGNIKPASKLALVLKNVVAVTIAHWIRTSRQAIEDSAQLESYIEQGLLWGVSKAEERAILHGTGPENGELDGVLKNAQVFDGGDDDMLVNLLLAMAEIELVGAPCDGIVMHPRDWAKLTTTKNQFGQFIFANPTDAQAGRSLWGVPVVRSTYLPQGNALVGAWRFAGTIWDRHHATVEISREDRDNFIRNAVTILGEERLALALYHPRSLLKVSTAGVGNGGGSAHAMTTNGGAKAKS